MAIRLPNEKQRRNLRLLGYYLLAGNLQAEFAMEGSEAHDSATECGSVGDAIEHGPYAGIPKSSNEDWYEYADRAFGAYNYWVFVHLFDSRWADHDNTPEGAGRRILAVLERIDQDTLTEDYLVERTPFVGDLSSAAHWL